MFWLSDGEEIMTLAFFALIQYRSVTDGRTDRQTDIPPLAIPAVCIARYANALVKMESNIFFVRDNVYYSAGIQLAPYSGVSLSRFQATPWPSRAVGRRCMLRVRNNATVTPKRNKLMELFRVVKRHRCYLYGWSSNADAITIIAYVPISAAFHS